jgi:hypothetical protein
VRSDAWLLAALVASGFASGCNVIAGAVAAAQPVYSSGDLAREHHDRGAGAASLGCLDVYLLVEGKNLDWRMGNRCNRPVLVDLTGLRIGDGSSSVPLGASIFDPKGEIAAHELAPRQEGHDRFRLEHLGEDAATLCFDLRDVTPSDRLTPPLCFERQDAGWVFVPGSS